MPAFGTIIAAARRVGFSLCAVLPSTPLLREQEKLCQWLESGHNSFLTYMGRNIDKRADPSLLVPGAKTVVVCGVNYRNASWSEKRTRVAAYAKMRDYHLTIKEMLGSVLDELRLEEPQLTGRCFTDSAPVFEKSWAERAGFGWIGRNSLLVSPRYGSSLLLGEIIIDAECDGYTAVTQLEDGCGRCRRCVDACPVGAINADRTIDARRCISCLTIEAKGETQQDTAGWIFGCDLCQVACPHNNGKPFTDDPRFLPLLTEEDFSRERWNDLTPERFAAEFGETPLSRAGYDMLRSRIIGAEE